MCLFHINNLCITVMSLSVCLCFCLSCSLNFFSFFPTPKCALMLLLTPFINIYMYESHNLMSFSFTVKLFFYSLCIVPLKYSHYLWRNIYELSSHGWFWSVILRQKLYYRHNVISRNEIQCSDLAGFSDDCTSHDDKIPWQLFLFIFSGWLNSWSHCSDVILVQFSQFSDT